MKTVTIGMPVFNDIDFIEASIQSILNQTHKDFILILSDDGASDGSELICQKLAAQDERINYIRQPENLGISKNMKFLLNEASTEFFMWAGDDDLYDPEFVEKCVKLLEESVDAIVSFSKHEIIDEKGNTIEIISNSNYTNGTGFSRLKELIKNPSDGFGYGLFRTESIKKVSFPTWWWPNKNTPYNNIYPTLCYYLAKGNYVESTDKSLFFKHVKTEENTNHKLIGQGNAFYETFAYIIRRFNLVTFSAREIRKAKSIGLMFRIYPTLYYRWFVVSTLKQLKLAASSFFKNRMRKTK